MLSLGFLYSISHHAFFEIDENALDDKTVNTTISLGSILALVFGLIGNNEIFAILQKKKKKKKKSISHWSNNCFSSAPKTEIKKFELNRETLD